MSNQIHARNCWIATIVLLTAAASAYGEGGRMSGVVGRGLKSARNGGGAAMSRLNQKGLFGSQGKTDEANEAVGIGRFDPKANATVSEPKGKSQAGGGGARIGGDFGGYQPFAPSTQPKGKSQGGGGARIRRDFGGYQPFAPSTQPKGKSQGGGSGGARIGGDFGGYQPFAPSAQPKGKSQPHQTARERILAELDAARERIRQLTELIRQKEQQLKQLMDQYQVDRSELQLQQLQQVASELAAARNELRQQQEVVKQKLKQLQQLENP